MRLIYEMDTTLEEIQDAKEEKVSLIRLFNCVSVTNRGSVETVCDEARG